VLVSLSESLESLLVPDSLLLVPPS